MPRIEAHVTGLAARLRQGLADRGFGLLTPPSNGSAIVSFTSTRPEAVARRVFADAGIAVTIRENGTMVRVSPALFNTAAEIDALLEACERLV